MDKEMMNRIAEAITGIIGTEYDVQFQEIEKNNGLKLQAVTIYGPEMDASLNVCPIIYIDGMLENIRSGKIGIQDAAMNIVNTYRSNKDDGKIRDMVDGLDKENILERTVYQLINAEKNAGRLAGMPHRKILDLAAVYKVILTGCERGTASITVNNEMCRMYGISEKELDEAARRNTEKRGFNKKPMVSVIAEIMGMPEGAFDVEESNNRMWVYTNQDSFYGAAVLLYESCFDKLARKLGSDLYLLPSSVHEIIAVPATDVVVPRCLKDIVGMVNAQELSEGEVLSENVYRYSLKTGRLTIV